ncbi:cytochrome b5-related protein-like [Periplaneta americana]|uniref:cytochrome b5-related protein-like n=1 Tax=Periplaneta americana TaxID=6978 RepID=UPI0037E94CC8
MPPQDGDIHLSSIPGLWKAPSFLSATSTPPTAQTWLQGKQKDDNTGGLWRVHNDLYDLTPFIDKHPGGSHWLTLTKGTDITEAFESHHIRNSAQLILEKYRVASTSNIRFSPYTFHESGFYRTLKRNVQPILSKLPSGPSLRSKLTADLLLLSSLLTATVAAATSFYSVGIVSGILFSLTVISAHNFFHMRDNIRMHYFNITFYSYKDWRVTHALSHHLFPNTMLDYELFFDEKLLQWLPLKTKSLWVRFGSWLYSPVIYLLSSHVQLIAKLAQLLKTRGKSWNKEAFIPFAPLLVMYIFSGSSFIETFIMWSWILIVSSFSFVFIGLNAAHHHPEIFHDGDAPRSDRDWGLGQVDAVRDRPEISTSLFLVLVTFGDHCLHHLFPTVDHSYLHLLYPTFYETCKQFGVDYQPFSILDLIKGQFRQLARNTPNPIPPGKAKD